jgi:hypothetical protein
VLLANLGVLSAAALQRLGDLWPLLLVILGIQLILNQTLPRPQASMIGLAAAAVIVIGAVTYAALAPATALGGGTQHATSSQRLTGLSSATLELNYSAASIEIGTGNVGDNLYTAKVDYPSSENPPNITLDQTTGTVSIDDNGGLNGFHFFNSGDRKLSIQLSTSVPWTIRISGGASTMRLDLPNLQLSNLDISGGANTLDAQLGSPKGTVAMHFNGGAHNVTVHIPSGSQWKVNVSGGLSSLTVNGQTSGGVGDFSKQSAGYTGASDRFDFEMAGGLSRFDLESS